MSFMDDVKNQFKADNNNISDTELPWTNSEATSTSTSGEAKMDTKKLVVMGVGLLILIICGIALYNFAFGGGTVSVEASDNSEEASEITVHVAGEVKNPGVYKFDFDARVWDAVEKAGGFTEKADKSSLNLAKQLEDGEQILIPELGGTSGGDSSASGTNNGKVNINTADLATLQTLSGVGPATAQKIIDYRAANGKFKTIEDIKKVSGIGDKTFQKFKDKICV